MKQGAGKAALGAMAVFAFGAMTPNPPDAVELVNEPVAELASRKKEDDDKQIEAEAQQEAEDSRERAGYEEPDDEDDEDDEDD